MNIRALIGDIAEPNLGGTLETAGVIAEAAARAGGADITLAFPYPAASAFADIVTQARARFAAAGAGEPRFAMRVQVHARTVQGGVQRLPGVKNIIAVASAKGGVGKSTTAANLALALAREGAAVGMLDADIYGPSLPVLLGAATRPQPAPSGGFLPVLAHGLRLMSIGFMVGDDQPMVWRGPIATRALTQLLRETQWGELDYLVLDMPPGTGDIQLTIAQQVPVTGAIVITTPQALAVADAARGLVMFDKVSIPVLGVLENMHAHVCPQCGHQSAIFDTGGGAAMCKKHDAELLGQIPLDAAIGRAADSGTPSVAADPAGAASLLYRKIAVRVAVKISQKARDRTAAFGQIAVAN